MQKHSKILNLTGNLVILAPPIAMTFTRVILRVQTETVYLHVQPTTPLRSLILQLQHITGSSLASTRSSFQGN